jgi:Tfp pilus assembly protein PilO
MSLINKIENLQKKPESIRRRILFVSIIAIMFVIIVVWIFTLNLSLSNNEKNETSYTPFKVFGGLVKDAYNVSLGSIKEAVDQLKKQFENNGNGPEE